MLLSTSLIRTLQAGAENLVQPTPWKILRASHTAALGAPTGAEYTRNQPPETAEVGTLASLQGPRAGRRLHAGWGR